MENTYESVEVLNKLTTSMFNADFFKEFTLFDSVWISDTEDIQLNLTVDGDKLYESWDPFRENLEDLWEVRLLASKINGVDVSQKEILDANSFKFIYLGITVEVSLSFVSPSLVVQDVVRSTKLIQEGVVSLSSSENIYTGSNVLEVWLETTKAEQSPLKSSVGILWDIADDLDISRLKRYYGKWKSYSVVTRNTPQKSLYSIEIKFEKKTILLTLDSQEKLDD